MAGELGIPPNYISDSIAGLISQINYIIRHIRQFRDKVISKIGQNRQIA